jgi:hypothetical protein
MIKPAIGRVSLRNVPETENGAQGNLMDNNQLEKAGVNPYDPSRKWYGVVAIPFIIHQSFWQDRQGKQIFHNKIR